MSDDLMVVVRPVEIFLPKEEKPKKVAKKRMTLAEKKAAGMAKPETAVVSTEKLDEMLAEIGKNEASLKIELPENFKLAPERKDMFDLDTLLLDLLGPEKDAERKQMEIFYQDAYALMRTSKRLSDGMRDYVNKKERESTDLQIAVFADIERLAFNTLKVKNGDSPVIIHRKDVSRKELVDGETAKAGTPERLHHEAFVMSKMALIPGAVERHNENQEKALLCLLDVETYKAEQEKAYLDAQALFAAADAIAAKYDWPKPSDKKDVKDNAK